MAHIVSCMLAADQDKDHSSLAHYIAKPGSPHPQHDHPLAEKPLASASDKSFVWRMYQPERKYQLFPRDKQQPVPGKGLDPEQAFALAMGQNGQNADKTEKSGPGSGLRLRIKEHNLSRRRKVSVPDLGPMTTVQEVPMDSPTIPGRPPLHERSVSAPGNSLKHQHNLSEVTICHSPILIENVELCTSSGSGSSPEQPTTRLAHSRAPLSPKSLAPLVIPTSNQSSTGSRLTRQLSLSRLRSGSTPVDGGLRSARTDDSPWTRPPYTPHSALTTPRSATTAVTSSTIPTPVSAPIDCHSSPKPWGEASLPSATTPREQKETFLDTSVTPKADPETRPPTYHNSHGHRRNHSESGSIMERGRPRKRNDVSGGTVAIGRSLSKRSKSAEQRAFETLPGGWRAAEAMNVLSHGEAMSLQKQALQQASRFEVLRKEDVEALSRELRQLDERTEYLRRTYQSLRAGRRNLHSRICQYLRSPRVAKFSHESMLKQEEALAELDTSIDDWVGKLEQAENRRTRVRQKLLEHVAAAVTLPLSPIPTGSPNGGGLHLQGVSESLQMAVGIRPPPANISTPPRSPTKVSCPSSSSNNGCSSGSPSPQRFAPHVPSTILEQPIGEEEEAAAEALRRAAVESIRIYAGDDVYALLADVENEFKIGSEAGGEGAAVPALSDDDRRRLHRAHSQELLNGGLSKKASAASIATNNTTSTTKTVASSSSTPTDAGEVFLTNAVFRP